MPRRTYKDDDGLETEVVLTTWASYDPFDKCFYSHEVGCMKPDLAIYEFAIKEMGFEPSECVFFDDVEENVEAARKVGMIAHQVVAPGKLSAGLQQAGINVPE